MSNKVLNSNYKCNFENWFKRQAEVGSAVFLIPSNTRRAQVKGTLMKNYTQLTQEQGYQIWALIKTGQNQTEIA